MQTMMKRQFFLLAAMAAAFACACTREAVSETAEYREISLSARSEGGSTKSSRDAEGYFYWTPGDEINVFRGSAAWKMTSTNEEPTPSAVFTGTAPASPGSGKYWAVYPYRADNSFDGTCLTTVVPSAQVAAEGTFADGQFVSIGCSDDLSMTFYHLCGGVKFTLENPGVTSVTLRGNNNEVLAGRVKVSMDSEGHPVVSEVLEAATEVTLTCTGGFKTGVEYFFVTLPVTFSSGFTVEFGSGLSRTVTPSSAMSVHRARFQWSQAALDSVFDFADESYDIENAGARSFLENVDYSNDPDYTLSYIKNYQSTGSSSPNPYTLSWTGGNASQILMSSTPVFTNPVPVSGTSSPVSVYNLIPGETYYFKVLGSGGKVLKASCVTPVGPIRMIYVPKYNPGGWDSNYKKNIDRNARDLGGWTADGGHIAYGKLYRGARLNDMQENSAAKEIFLNTLGIDIDLDLRGQPSGSQGGSGEYNPWLASDPVEYCNIQPWNYFVNSTQQSLDPDISKMGATAELYQLALRNIIGWLGEGKVVYFHCHGGSDRTGTLAFLIEALMGVSEADLSKDYELTYFSGSYRRRNGNYGSNRTASDGGWFFSPMVRYLRTFAPSGTIKDQVTAWAKTRHSNSVDPLTDAEIGLLRQYLLVAD